MATTIDRDKIFQIKQGTLTDIADAIRQKNPNIGDRLIPTLEMRQAVLDIPSGGGDIPTETLDINTEGLYNVVNYANANVNIDQFAHINREHNLDPADWVRPSDWQPMANGYATGEQLYMVYDTELLPSDAIQCACWYVTTSSSATNVKLERGYVDTDGVYQSVSNTTFNRSTTYAENLPNIGQRYIVYKITPSGGTGHITGVFHDRSTAIDANLTGNDWYTFTCQPMIEAYGSLPYVTSFYSASYRKWNAFYEVHHDVRNLTSLTNCSYMFYFGGCLECVDGIDTWNTANVTTFAYMFYNCRLLQYIDLSNLIVTSKATTLVSMFYNCHSLCEVCTDNWDTQNITSFQSMFYNCFNLVTCNTKKFIGEKVTRLDTMFYYCFKIREIDLSGIKTPNMSSSFSAASLFNSCSNVQKIDISGLTTTANASCASMFAQCSALRQVIFGPGFTTGNVTTFSAMFQYCYSLTSIIGMNGWDTSKVTNMSNTFRDCRSLKSLDLSSFNTSKVTTFESTFQNCYNLEELILPDNMVTSLTATLNSTFYMCLKLREINTTGWNTQSVTTMANLFNGCRKLINYGDASNWNYDKVTTMASMFANCTTLSYLPNFSNKTFPLVTTWASIFTYCTNIQGELVMNNVSLPKATTLANAFQGLVNVNRIEVNNWDIPLVTTVTYTFSYLDRCQEIEATGWTSPKLATLTYLFYYSYALRNLNCDIVATGTTAPSNMFNYCYSLQNITAFPIVPKNALTINNSTILTLDSLLVILNALPTLTTSYKLTIGTANLNKLSAEQKAIATNKKWTLA